MKIPAEALSSDGYIVNQLELDEIAFKDSKIADTGCGVIAIYNAMKYVGMKPDFDDINRYLSKTSITTKFGTNFLQLIGYLRKKRIYAGMTTCKKQFSKIDIGILYYCHKQGFHWVTFYKDSGKYRFLNVSRGYDNKRVTMDEFLKNHVLGSLCLLAIKIKK